VILDSLEQAARYERYLPWLEPAFGFLRQRATPALSAGRHEIDGDRMFALVARYTTRNYESAHPEAHRRYLDVQYLISGRETVYWTPLADVSGETIAYDDERDLIFFERNDSARPVELWAGQFAIFFPEDAHEPNCHLGAPGEVHKVVVKVRVES
jgi:YhcH/YjgK/YiaL family protein